MTVCAVTEKATYAVTKAKLKKGEFVFCRRGNVVVCKWKDKKDVLTIGNTRTNPEEVPVSNRRGDQNQKPSIVRDYNKGIPGIDRTDQMLSYLILSMVRKCWYSLFGDVFSKCLLPLEPI